jgi:hypothetical protein
LTPAFYDERELELRLHGARSIFLAGPTSRGVQRTAWRAQALELLAGFDGLVVLPEFERTLFEHTVSGRFGEGRSQAPGMRIESFNVLHWETTGIERATVVLFWMPFTIADASDPSSLPGFTTRAEVSRELARDPSRIVLGMPAKVLGGGHIRFHAHRAGLTIHDTLEATVAAAVGASAK